MSKNPTDTKKKDDDQDQPVEKKLPPISLKNERSGV